MNILLGFAPYIAFFLFMQAVSIDGGLWAALIVGGLIAGRNWRRSGSLKVLEAGTVLVFATLVIFTAAEHWSWNLQRSQGGCCSWSVRRHHSSKLVRRQQGSFNARTNLCEGGFSGSGNIISKR